MIDTAGPAVAALLRDRIDAHIAWMKMVPDETEQIAKLLKDLVERLQEDTVHHAEDRRDSANA
jgi:hypothetical protein